MILYKLDISGPCRAVQLLISVLGLKVEETTVDLFKGEHLTPSYLRLNNHHTVPTFQDDVIVLSESRAIMQYLINKYAQGTPNASLYPSDPVKRGFVDQALYWEATSLYPAVRAVIFPIIRRNQASLNVDDLTAVDEKLALMNEDLIRNPFIAGSEMTIADISLIATWTSILATGLWKTDKLTGIHAWFKRMHETGRIKNWETVVVGSAKAYGDIIKSKMNAK